MKQRITIDQLQELTEEQQQRLEEWWKPEEGDLVYNKFFNEFKQEELPLLDIGQMIELLRDTRPKVNIYFSGSLGNEITIPFDKIPSLVSAIAKESDICDCLWSAVKQVL
jgi:hypothetical protein